MSEGQLMKLLEEIRDIQKQGLELFKAGLKHQEESLTISRAVRQQSRQAIEKYQKRSEAFACYYYSSF